MDELELIVDDVTAVAEPYQTLYVEKDGKFHLNVKVKGMKPETEFAVVHNALRKERTDHAATKQKVKPFEALGNLDDVQAQLLRIPELEIAAEGKIDDKKVDKIVEQRVVSRIAPVQRERDTLKTQNDDLVKQIDGFKVQERTRKVHDTVRAAAAKVNVRGEAMEDALMLAERVFEVREDDGAVVIKEGVGLTPGLDPQSWFSEIQPKRPHWFADSVGGGATGSTGSSAGVNPWTAENWNMTEQGRIYMQSQTRAENMAKAAGTTIGGSKPALRKK